MCFSEAFALTPSSGLPRINPITLAGVFSEAKFFNLATSAGSQCFPAFLVYFGIAFFLPPTDTNSLVFELLALDKPKTMLKF